MFNSIHSFIGKIATSIVALVMSIAGFGGSKVSSDIHPSASLSPKPSMQIEVSKEKESNAKLNLSALSYSKIELPTTKTTPLSSLETTTSTSIVIESPIPFPISSPTEPPFYLPQDQIQIPSPDPEIARLNQMLFEQHQRFLLQQNQMYRLRDELQNQIIQNQSPSPMPTLSPIINQSMKSITIYDSGSQMLPIVKWRDRDLHTINLRIIVRDDNGVALSDKTVIVETPDSVQNQTVNGTGNVNPFYDEKENRKIEHYYPFYYEFKTAGAHIINVRVPSLDLEKSVSLTAFE